MLVWLVTAPMFATFSSFPSSAACWRSRLKIVDDPACSYEHTLRQIQWVVVEGG